MWNLIQGGRKMNISKLSIKLDSSNRAAVFLRENMGIIIALVVLCVFLSFFPGTNQSFPTQRNVFNVLRQISTNMLLACGMTMVIILGGIDLSVDSIIALTGVLAAGCVSRYNLPIPVAFAVGILIGVVFGIFNGMVVSKTTIPPFIVTLATMNIARGLSGVYTGGSPVRVVSKAWQWLGAGYIGPFPVPVIIMIIVFIISLLILNNTKTGRHIYAVGGNTIAAQFSGIKVSNVKFFVYLYSGLMAGIAGVILASRMYSGQPTAGEGAEMDAIAAVVVGGTSMSGGSGKLGGTLIGALIIGVLNNGLNLMNVNSFWQTVLKGVVILLAVFLDYIRNIKKQRA